MESIEFFMSMVPPTTTHQTKRARIVNGKPQFYESDKLVQVRKKLLWALAPHKPKEEMTGAISLTVRWAFPAKGKNKPGTWRTTRPDLDNLHKLLADVMTNLGFWHDDSQVCKLTTEKVWARNPGIYIRVDPIE